MDGASTKVLRSECMCRWSRASSMLSMKSKATQSDFHAALHFPTLERRGQQAPPRNLTRVHSFLTFRGRRMQNSISENKRLFLHNIDWAWRWRLSDSPWDEDPMTKHAWTKLPIWRSSLAGLGLRGRSNWAPAQRPHNALGNSAGQAQSPAEIP